MPAVEALEPTDPPSIGAYRLTGRLGQGGQGVVYLGESKSGAQVAIKFFQIPLDKDPALRNAIVRELKTAEQVARFCTAQVLDSGMVGSRPYIVSEYVPGPSLQQVVTDEGPLSGSALDRLAIGTATALVSLHDAGVIHCDFKPGNVLLGPDGWRVIDFGISRMNTGTQTLASRVTGTPPFMAPEQLVAGPLGPAVDVFAWASTMAFAAAGNPPFGYDTIPAVMNRIAHRPPDLSGVEEPLRGVLADCLVKDPAQRPSAQQVLDRLVRPGGKTAELPTPAGPAHGNGPGAGFAPGGGHNPHGPSDRVPQNVPVPGAGAPPAYAPPQRETVSLHGAGPGWSIGQGASSAHTAAGHVVVGPRRGARIALGAGITAVVAAVSVTAIWLLPSEGSTEAIEPGASSGSADGGDSPAVRRPGRIRPGGQHATASPEGPAPGTTPSRRRAAPTAPSARPESPSLRRVELGQGHFSEYCVTLGWEWVEWRDNPKPGAYCVKRAGDIMYLTAAQRDAGCRWRFNDPRARHYFKSKTNYCYTYR